MFKTHLVLCIRSYVGVASPHGRAQAHAGGVMPTVKIKLAKALSENGIDFKLANHKLM